MRSHFFRTILLTGNMKMSPEKCELLQIIKLFINNIYLLYGRFLEFTNFFLKLWIAIVSLRGKAEAIHVHKGIVLCGLLRFARNDGIGVHTIAHFILLYYIIYNQSVDLSKLQNGSRGFFGRCWSARVVSTEVEGGKWKVESSSSFRDAHSDWASCILPAIISTRRT